MEPRGAGTHRLEPFGQSKVVREPQAEPQRSGRDRTMAIVLVAVAVCMVMMAAMMVGIFTMMRGNSNSVAQTPAPQAQPEPQSLSNSITAAVNRSLGADGSTGGDVTRGALAPTTLAPATTVPLAQPSATAASATPRLAPPAKQPLFQSAAPAPQAGQVPAHVRNMATWLRPDPACIGKLAAMADGATVRFGPSSVEVSNEDAQRILQLARTVSRCAGMRLTVAGHSDPAGDPEINMKLSWQRAENVMDVIRNAGFDMQKFTVIGYGSNLSQWGGPAVSSERRVEFQVSNRVIPRALIQQASAGAAAQAQQQPTWNVGQPAPQQKRNFAPALEAFLVSQVKGWAQAPTLIQALRDQNQSTAILTQTDIQLMDSEWRANVDQDGSPTIAAVLNHPASSYLRKIAAGSGGTVTEIFVMDARGLNVAASHVTSDYWQGDEAKYQLTFPRGPGTHHMSEVEFDDSTQSYQAQISVTIEDPETGQAIGVITVGVNADTLL